MANELVLNKILIIKGILAEKCGLPPDLYDELSDLLDGIRILNNAKDNALAELSDELGNCNKPTVIKSVCPECGMTPPMVGRLDFEYMACDTCGTKWKG